MYVKEGSQNRWLGVALWLYRGVGVGHVEEPTAFLLGAATANVAGGHQTGHRVEERIVLGRQHLAYVLLLEREQTREIAKRRSRRRVRPFGKSKRESKKIRLSNYKINSCKNSAMEQKNL